MTTLSDLNIVVQQSGGAKAAQRIQHAVQEQSQLAAGQQRTREDEQRTTIQHSEDSKHTRLQEEAPEKRPDQRSGRKKDRRREKRRDGRTGAEAAGSPQGHGKFVDTVA